MKNLFNVEELGFYYLLSGGGGGGGVSVLCPTNSYGDRTSVYSLIRKTGEARDRTYDPWFTRRVALALTTPQRILCTRIKNIA